MVLLYNYHHLELISDLEELLASRSRERHVDLHGGVDFFSL